MGRFACFVKFSSVSSYFRFLLFVFRFLLDLFSVCLPNVVLFPAKFAARFNYKIRKSWLPEGRVFVKVFSAEA